VLTNGNGKHTATGEEAGPLHWVPLQGDWEFTPEQIRFQGGSERFQAHGRTFPLGLALSNRTLQSGRCRVSIQFSETPAGSHFTGGLLLGFRSSDRYNVQVQLGAGQAAYSVTEFIAGFGWRPLQVAGPLTALRPDQRYLLESEIVGQQVRIKVDGVRVLEVLLSRPLEGKQAGLIAAGEHGVIFRDFEVLPDRPRIFVAMQYCSGSA